MALAGQRIEDLRPAGLPRRIRATLSRTALGGRRARARSASGRERSERNATHEVVVSTFGLEIQCLKTGQLLNPVIRWAILRITGIIRHLL